MLYRAPVSHTPKYPNTTTNTTMGIIRACLLVFTKSAATYTIKMVSAIRRLKNNAVMSVMPPTTPSATDKMRYTMT